MPHLSLITFAKLVATFTVSETESENINPNSGKPYTERRLEKVEAGSHPDANASPTPPAQAPASQDAMTKEEWARKDSAIHKMACIKTAADALKHTLPSDPSADDIAKYLGRVSTLSSAWHRSVLAERNDPTGEDVPF